MQGGRLSTRGGKNEVNKEEERHSRPNRITLNLKVQHVVKDWEYKWWKRWKWGWQCHVEMLKERSSCPLKLLLPFQQYALYAPLHLDIMCSENAAEVQDAWKLHIAALPSRTCPSTPEVESLSVSLSLSLPYKRKQGSCLAVLAI